MTYQFGVFDTLVGINFKKTPPKPPTGGRSEFVFTRFGRASGRPYYIVVAASLNKGFPETRVDGPKASDWVEGSPFQPFIRPDDKEFKVSLPPLKDLVAMLPSSTLKEFFLGIYYVATDIVEGATWDIAYNQLGPGGTIIAHVTGGNGDRDFAGDGGKMRLTSPHGIIKINMKTGVGKWES